MGHWAETERKRKVRIVTYFKDIILFTVSGVKHLTALLIATETYLLFKFGQSFFFLIFLNDIFIQNKFERKPTETH